MNILEKHEDKWAPEPMSGCFLWHGAQTTAGYGMVTIKCKQHYVHRLSYEDAKGSIPEGLQIDHLCRTPSCVNPDHLEAVTSRENTRRGSLKAVTRARHAAKTHCRHGHPLSGDNLGRDRLGKRYCKVCKRARYRAWYRKNQKERLDYYREWRATRGQP